MPYTTRAREVNDLMAKEGELGVRKAIIKLAENDSIIMQELAEIKALFNKMIDQMLVMQQVTSSMGKAVADHHRKFYPDNEANPENQDWSKS